jgi:Skp family chaperone for outer membrane proteins
MITIRTLVASVALVVAAVPALAQELKIGYVNSEKVLREAAPAKAAPRACCRMHIRTSSSRSRPKSSA